MFETTLHRMLELFPRGVTNEQIIWRLKSSGLRVDASELLNDLVRLSERGVVVRHHDGRWKLTQFSKPARQPDSSRNRPAQPGVQQGAISGHLSAVAAICHPVIPTESANPAQGADDLLPEWSSILGYYAATQRRDPRGQIEEFGDRHGLTWQLFRTAGQWWGDAQLRIDASALPATFREALARRNTDAAALGWPLTMFEGTSGTSFIPALLLPADWRFEGENVVFSIENALPALNPAWIREIRKRASWTESAIQDCLFPEGEEIDLASIGERMKHAFATLGGGALRPGDLASEITIGGNGLRNSAAIFIPEDGSFTKGTAEDLESLRGWDEHKRSGTALSALLANLPPVASDQTVPLVTAKDLTPSQIDAAEFALDGPVTVIQGPPGTGKSEAILSLMLSMVMSGRTVLFAAKNHQAIDEVERRLKEIVPDAPIFVRGRDAEGERDTSFFNALSEIAKGETRPTGQAIDPESVRQSLVAAASEAARSRRSAEEMVRLHVEASELSERLDLLERYKGSRGVAPAALSFWHRLHSWFTRIFGRHTRAESPLPLDAPLRDVEARLAALKDKLSSATLTASTTLSERGSLQDDLLALFPKLAEWVTRPDRDEWAWAAERLRELEFDRIRSARRMSSEDAMLVLRHRPIWAVSTLSVPSRIPPIPRLFDYVIFDEASQCDIASALPLLARAKKAIIVGDPMQLRFVPSLGNAAEHALMDAAGLPAAGRASFAQSINSLFDFAERRPVTRRMFLADQFRSAPAIVDYLNQDFYDGRLIGRRENDFFNPPSGYKPGLTWEDVSGVVTRRDGGNVNKAEAERIAALVRKLAEDRAFTGTVGVISPFNAQVSEIQTVIGSIVSQVDRDRLKLRIATIDKFQGAETDVLFFSLVIAAGAPFSAKTFLQKERRRLNVAVSRARALCIVVGDLGYAKSCFIRHIEFLAMRATTPWSPPKPQFFDSEWERRLDVAMRTRGLEPHPQFAVGTRYLDFALDPDGRKLDVEVDGRRWHTDASGNRKVGDILRDREMKARGWKVLRFWVHELANDMEGCVDRIERELRGH